MHRKCFNHRGLKLVQTGLAAWLVVMFLALAGVSALHRNHQDHPAGQHTCAVCLMVHGGLLADGATGTAVIFASHSLDLPTLGETAAPSTCDLRLAPGRAPPV